MTQPAEERLVSIIVPVFNAQDTLERCLLSLRAAACWRPDFQDMSRLRRHLPRYILTAQAARLQAAEPEPRSVRFRGNKPHV